MAETWLLAAGETQAALSGRKFESAEELLKAAMRRTKDHWLETSDEGRFKAAIGAALMLAAPDDKERIEKAVEPLKMLGAMVGGIPVDLVAIESRLGEWKDVIPLQRLWLDVKAEDHGSAER
jgi:hypothetical protein